MNYEDFLSNRVRNSISSATVGIADKVRLLKEAGHEVIDFSAGRAFEATPSYIIEAAAEAMNKGATHQTMARGTTTYRAACAKKLARENGIEADPEKEIIATMGCKQGLTISLLALLNPGDEVIVEDPCFVSYIQTIEYFGGVAVPVPLLPENNFRWTRDLLLEAVTPKTRAIILCSPQNPTGVVHTREDLEAISSIAIDHELFVITDEPYERTVWGGRKHLNLASIPGMKERTITLMSLTKSFSMGGWRIGFAYAETAVIDQMMKLQQHLITCASSVSQAGGQAAFEDPPRDEVLQYWKEWGEKVNHFTKALNSLPGITCPTPEGGFYGWVDLSSLNLSGEEFADRLLQEHQVAIVPGIAFGQTGMHYVRINCVKTWAEIEEGLKRITSFVHTLS